MKIIVNNSNWNRKILSTLYVEFIQKFQTQILYYLCDQQGLSKKGFFHYLHVDASQIQILLKIQRYGINFHLLVWCVCLLLNSVLKLHTKIKTCCLPYWLPSIGSLFSCLKNQKNFASLNVLFPLSMEIVHVFKKNQKSKLAST